MVRERVRVASRGCGLYAAQIGTSYGVTGFLSPSPECPQHASVLAIRESRVLMKLDSELLVQSGHECMGQCGAHKTYFRKIDEIIVEIFNRPL